MQRLFSSVHYSIEYIDSMCPRKLWTMLARCKMNFIANICIEFLFLCKRVGHLFFISFSLFKLSSLFVCSALTFFCTLCCFVQSVHKNIWRVNVVCVNRLNRFFFSSFRCVVYFWMGNLLILFKHAINAGNWSLQIGYCEWIFFSSPVPPELNKCGTATKLRQRVRKQAMEIGQWEEGNFGSVKGWEWK